MKVECLRRGYPVNRVSLVKMHLNPIQKILTSKLIACAASLHPNLPGNCLSLHAAADVVLKSHSGALIYHVPTTIKSEDLKAYTWSFPDLLQQIGDVSKYVILANTSRAANAEEAVVSAQVGAKWFKALANICQHQQKPIIKLEVLNRQLESEDTEVISATKTLICSDNFTVIPLLSPNINNIITCSELGVPAVRILAGKIGSMSGMLDMHKLELIVHHSPIPVIFEGGMATSEHIAQALDIGACAVLVNTAFRCSDNPGRLANQLRRTIDAYSTNTLESRRIQNEQGSFSRRTYFRYNESGSPSGGQQTSRLF